MEDRNPGIENLIIGCRFIYLSTSDFQGTQTGMCGVRIQCFTLKGKGVLIFKIFVAKEGIVPGILTFIAFPAGGKRTFLAVPFVGIIYLDSAPVIGVIVDYKTVSCIAAKEIEFADSRSYIVLWIQSR